MTEDIFHVSMRIVSNRDDWS